MANQKKTFMSVLLNGLIWENPTFVLMLGMCPTLAITTSGMNGIGMGLAVTAVLIFSNLFISLLRNIIPDSVRIPAYIIIIASFVTMIDMLLKAFLPDLSQALGMFIPLELNTPLLIGGAISWYVGSRSTDQALNSVRLERGTLLASGFIAGGALMGVVSAAMRFAGINLLNTEWMESNAAGGLAVVMYVILITYLAISSLKTKK